mgnify:FL=1
MDAGCGLLFNNDNINIENRLSDTRETSYKVSSYKSEDYSNSWEDERESIISELKSYRKEIFQRFMNDCNFHDNFFYEMCYRTHICTIYTTKPGLWIGKNGNNIKVLTEILSSDSIHWDVKIKEIKGTYLSL